jgi:hypothetical protein
MPTWVVDGAGTSRPRVCVLLGPCGTMDRRTGYTTHEGPEDGAPAIPAGKDWR